MKIKLVRVQNNKSQAGFSMLESMVAAMISLIFMSLGANLVLAANIQKIVAKRNIMMNNLVQSDLDSIKYQAKILDKGTETSHNAKCNPADRSTGYAAALKDRLGDGTTTPSSKETNVKVFDRTYIMKRTTSYDTATDKDSRILKIAYEFTTNRTSATKDYELYAEIMPNQASSCPSSIVAPTGTGSSGTGGS